MKDYMYLMAKLPYLGVFPPPFPVEINLEDYKEFQKIKKSKNRILYENFLAELEKEILEVRKGEVFTPKMFNEHLIKMNPYEREFALLRIKWRFIEQFPQAEPNNDWLWIYKEKVNIINNFQSFDINKGTKKYEEYIEEVRKNATQ